MSGESSRELDSVSGNQRGYRIEEGTCSSRQVMAIAISSREPSCKPIPGRRAMKGRGPWVASLADPGGGQGLGCREGRTWKKLP